MSAKDRHFLHQFLIKGPLLVGAILGFFVATSLTAAGIWPEAKEWVADGFVGVRKLMNWWLLGASIAVSSIWLWALLVTRDQDDMSLEGAIVGGDPMTGDDSRRGIFNDSPNQGTQNYYEGPQQRLASESLTAAFPDAHRYDVTIQVRIYGMDAEMQTFGRDLASKLAASGFNTILFNGDHGTRYLKGVIVEPAPNAPSQELALAISNALSSGGTNVSLGQGPEAWSEQRFVRIGIGGNG